MPEIIIKFFIHAYVSVYVYIHICLFCFSYLSLVKIHRGCLVKRLYYYYYREKEIYIYIYFGTILVRGRSESLFRRASLIFLSLFYSMSLSAGKIHRIPYVRPCCTSLNRLNTPSTCGGDFFLYFIFSLVFHDINRERARAHPNVSLAMALCAFARTTHGTRLGPPPPLAGNPATASPFAPSTAPLGRSLFVHLPDACPRRPFAVSPNWNVLTVR